jgi:hypothetical protein
MACRLESQAGENSTIHLTSIAAPDIVAVTLDDQPGQWTARGIGTDISLPASMEGVKLQVWYRGRLTSTAVFDLHAAPA